MIRTGLKILLPLLLLAAGVGFAVHMVRTAPKAKKAPAIAPSMLVEAMVVRPTRHATRLRAEGVVQPDRVVALAPQVAGVVARLGDGLQLGARVRAGDELLRIDDRDLRLALAQRRADVVQARAALDQELGRGAVAEREWQAIEGAALKGSRLGVALALRKPQIEAARARVEAAESAVARAELDVVRCRVEAPFDAIVRERRVAEGQQVSPQTVVAVLVATDRAFVQVSLPLPQLVWLAVPGVGGVAEEAGSRARVFAAGGGAERSGRVVRLLADLDPNGRMARLLVEVAAPYDVPAPVGAVVGAPASSPLLIGAFVAVELEGISFDGIVRLPRTALREGERAYVVGAGDRLEVRALDIAFREQDHVLVRGGLFAGDRVVTSAVPSAEPGMKLKVDVPPHGAVDAPAALTAATVGAASATVGARAEEGR